jgi:hypothetical protein
VANPATSMERQHHAADFFESDHATATQRATWQLCWKVLETLDGATPNSRDTEEMGRCHARNEVGGTPFPLFCQGLNKAPPAWPRLLFVL